LHLLKKELAPAAEDDENIFTAECPEDPNANKVARPARGQGFLDGVPPGKPVCLFKEIDAADICQGGLGDCWLLSGFAAMCEYPQALMGLFTQKTLAEDSQYDINLYNFVDGEWQVQTIDDRIPVTGWSSRAAYVAPTGDNELWPCLLEKAFAQMFGGYGELDGGLSTTAFAGLCGAGKDELLVLLQGEDLSWRPLQPTLEDFHGGGAMVVPWPDGSEDNKSNEDLFSVLAGWDASNYVMCAGSESGSDTHKSPEGIVQGHAYTLIAVKEDIAGSGISLLQLRNPWGQEEWQGDWSDHSEKWDEHPEVKAEIDPDCDEDGAFWITMEDFSSQFQTIFVCMKDMGPNKSKTTKEKSEASRQKMADTDVPPPEKKTKKNVKDRKKGKGMKVKGGGCKMC
jgi:calpain-15